MARKRNRRRSDAMKQKVEQLEQTIQDLTAENESLRQKLRALNALFENTVKQDSVTIVSLMTQMESMHQQIKKLEAFHQ